MKVSYLRVPRLCQPCERSNPLRSGARPTRPWHTRAGTAALEFVIVLPVLMVIVIGATDLSRRLYYDNVLTNAARSGAAYGATHAYSDYSEADWTTRVEALVLEEASNLPDFKSGKFTVDVTSVDDADGSRRIEVEVSHPFEVLIPWPGWPTEVTLRHHTTMRRYR